jgi:hypothetical protein
MTTIPGHNQILQQSTIAQELSNQGNALKPSPDQAVVQQQAQEIAKGSTVQNAEESERLKEEKIKQKEKRARKRRQNAGRKKEKKINHNEEMALDPDTTGRLLDTTV